MILEIKPLSNGAHRNQNWDGALAPGGYVLVRSGADIPYTFPFVFFDVVDGYAENMSPNVEAYEAAMADQPEPDEPEQPDSGTITEAEMAAAILEGVNGI